MSHANFGQRRLLNNVCKNYSGTRLLTVNHRPFLSDFFLRGGAVCTQARTSASEWKRKKAIPESTVNSQPIGITLKLEAIKKTLSVQGQKIVL